MITPREELVHWKRLLRVQIQMAAFCMTRLRRHNVMAMSAALSFRTLFAMIPILVLIFLVGKSFNVIDNDTQVLQNIFHQTGLDEIRIESAPKAGAAGAPVPAVPATDPPAPVATSQPAAPTSTVTVADTLSELLTKVQKQLTLGNLGPVGIALLIWTALALLATMERSLNRIFEAPRARPLLRRIIIYWALITLTPIVYALVTYLFDNLDEWATGRASVEWILDIVGVITPIAVTTVLLALFYTLMPNVTVRFRSAVAAAFVAVLIWTLSRAGLAIYVQQVAGRNIYGAIGLIPLFMIWMNLSWYIFLFGAQLCCTISHIGQLGWSDSMDSETAAPNPWLNLAVMTTVADHFAQQGKPTTLHQLCETIGYGPITTKPLVQSMIDQGMLCTITSEGTEGLIPAKPLNKLPLADLLDASENPDSLPPQLSPATRSLLEPVRQKIQTALQRDTLEPTGEPKA